MRLYFIRHGQSENNLNWDLTGSDTSRKPDPRLTPAGWEQARVTAEFLRAGCDHWDGEGAGEGFGFTHLYCSPMARALATGTVISQALQMPLHIWTDWHECGGIYHKDLDSGEYEIHPGLTRAEIQREFPAAIPDEHVRENGEQGWWNRPFEDEPGRVLRARRLVQELRTRHGGSTDRVAVVGHGGFYVRFVAALLNIEHTRPVWLHMDNTGISRFDFRENETALIYHNATQHLPARLIT